MKKIICILVLCISMDIPFTATAYAAAAVMLK